MRATGIVRRIDDLGRIVIPREIRKEMGIEEGDPLEIFTERINGQSVICFAPYVVDLSKKVEFLMGTMEYHLDYDDPNRKAILENLSEVKKMLKKGKR